MGVVVGEQGFGIRLLDVGAVDTDCGRDEDEVYLLAFGRRDVAIVVPGIGGAGVVGRHVVGIEEFDNLTI